MRRAWFVLIVTLLLTLGLTAPAQAYVVDTKACHPYDFQVQRRIKNVRAKTWIHTPIDGNYAHYWTRPWGTWKWDNGHGRTYRFHHITWDGGKYRDYEHPYYSWYHRGIIHTIRVYWRVTQPPFEPWMVHCNMKVW